MGSDKRDKRDYYATQLALAVLIFILGWCTGVAMIYYELADSVR